MGPFVVELGDKSVEARLLLKEVHARRTGGFRFERAMHAFMAAVLLGMSWLDALDLNAEAEPPDGELRQLERAVGGGEGHAIAHHQGLVGRLKAGALEVAMTGRRSPNVTVLSRTSETMTSHDQKV